MAGWQDKRRLSNCAQYLMVTGAAFAHPVSRT
jgi:hypothetical protein